MTKRVTELTCPMCAAELGIEQLFAHAEDRQAFARLASISIPLGARVLAYISLFAPAKNRMTIARKVKLIDELLPDLVRGEIDRKGRSWSAPHEDWRAAIDQMLAARDAGKLSLPLTSHGYLYEILAGMADKAEASRERQVEQDRREHRPPTSSSTASVSDLLGNAIDALTSASIAPTPPPGPGLYARRIRAEIAAHQAKLKESSQ